MEFRLQCDGKYFEFRFTQYTLVQNALKSLQNIESEEYALHNTAILKLSFVMVQHGFLLPNSEKKKKIPRLDQSLMDKRLLEIMFHQEC